MLRVRWCLCCVCCLNDGCYTDVHVCCVCCLCAWCGALVFCVYTGCYMCMSAVLCVVCVQCSVYSEHVPCVDLCEMSVCCLYPVKNMSIRM